MENRFCFTCFTAGVGVLVVVIFDWDGTIVDSMPLFLKTLQAFAAKYFNVSAETAKEVYYRNIGGSLEEIFRQIAILSDRDIPKEKISGITQRVARSYYKEFLEKSKSVPVFPDVPGVLSELKSRSYDLCISSGGFKSALVHGAKAKGLYYLFTFILGSRRGFSKGEDHFNFIAKKLFLRPTEMAFVGDGTYDMEVGKSYGCFTIGRIDLLDENTLRSAGADVVVRDFQSLPRIIKEKIG